MNLEALAAFVQVAEAGSLTRAAELLDKPQPVLSRKIAALERECGGHLFVRTGRGVVLTSLGERVLVRARTVLRETAQIRAEARSGSDQGLQGTVSVGLIPSVAGVLVAPLFFRLRQEHPGVMLRLFESFSGELAAQMEDGQLDMAVLLRGGAVLQHEEVSFGTWDTHLVGPPGDRVTAAERITFRDLAGLPLVLPSAPSGARKQLEDIARSQGITLDVVAEANSGAATLALIDSGAGYSVSPATPPLTFMSAQVAAGRAQAALLTQPGITRTLVLRQGERRSAAAAEVARVVRATVEDLQSGRLPAIRPLA